MKRMIVLLMILMTSLLFTSTVSAQQISPDAQQAESSQMSGHEGHHIMAQEKTVQEEPADLMSEHDQMLSMMKKMDQELESKVTSMNTAINEKDQIDAMKAVINELVSQREQMHQKMMGMQGKMCKMMGEMKSKGEEGHAVMEMGKGPEGKEKNMIVIIQQ